MDWSKLLGTEPLVSGGGSGSIGVKEALADQDVVGIYFSAQWCGPCRATTPVFVEVYNKLKKAGKKFEIVFASSDRTGADFDKYFKEMPWLALDFDERETKNALSARYGVRGIPTLVLLDGKTGKTITKDGRAALMEDREGAHFPWTPPTFAEALGDAFQRQDGTVATAADAVAGKYVGLYFSASWCPPCQSFSPILIACYEKLRAARQDVEFVYVSSDRDEAAFDAYRAKMPFLAVPYADRGRKARLSQLFDVEGIPTFVLVGPDGKIINDNARGAVMRDPDGAAFPWHPPALVDLDDGPDGINEFPSLVVFAEHHKDRDALVAALTDIAVAARAAEGGADGDGDGDADDPAKKMRFFTCKADCDIGARVRALVSLPAKDAPPPAMVILNVPAVAYYTPAAGSDGGITVDAIKAFLADHAAGKLKATPLKH